MTDEDDRAVLRSVARGDKVALKQLYGRYHPGLIRFVEGRLQDAVEAADVVQETFLSVWRQAEGFEGRSSVKTWIFSIARNKAIDRLRQARKTEPLSDEFDLADPSIDLVAVSEGASDARRLRACIAKLGPHHRRAIQLAFFDDLSYAEIAEIEQTPEGTVKTRIFHAKRLLMYCLTKGPASG